MKIFNFSRRNDEVEESKLEDLLPLILDEDGKVDENALSFSKEAYDKYKRDKNVKDLAMAIKGDSDVLCLDVFQAEYLLKHKHLWSGGRRLQAITEPYGKDVEVYAWAREGKEYAFGVAESGEGFLDYYFGLILRPEKQSGDDPVVLEIYMATGYLEHALTVAYDYYHGRIF